MSEIPNPFLSADEERCLICGGSLAGDSSLITQSGWPSLQKQAREWSSISLNPGDEFYEFTQILKRIKHQKLSDFAWGIISPQVLIFRPCF